MFTFSITERMDTTSWWILPFPAWEEGRWWSDSCQDAGWTDHRICQGARDDCLVSFRSSIHYHSCTVTLTDLWLWSWSEDGSLLCMRLEKYKYNKTGPCTLVEPMYMLSCFQQDFARIRSRIQNNGEYDNVIALM